MGYEGIELRDALMIDKIYSIHYFEYMSDFSFPGESHDFWELVCVDKGEVIVQEGNESHILKKGELMFHRPNVFHSVRATGDSAPNLVVISFGCRDEELAELGKGILSTDETERGLLANIIIEARRCFDCRLDDPYLQNMPLKQPGLFGAEQLIKIYLQHFLIHIVRRYTGPIVLQKRPVQMAAAKTMDRRNDAETFNHIVDYMEGRLDSQLSIQQICRDNLISRSQLSKIFKECSGMGAIEYFLHMKTEAAKQLIRDSSMNFTQISERLGYSSMHYFSRQFKNLVGMSPSEYVSSIMAIAEGGFNTAES